MAAVVQAPPVPDTIVLTTIYCAPQDTANGDPSTLIEPSSSALVMSRPRLITLLFILTMVNFLSSFTTGLLTSAIPVIAESINLPEDLMLWPSSAYALASGSLLILAGSIGDALNNRIVFLTGAFLASCFVLASGLSRNGMELIVLRAMQGTAGSCCVANCVGILTRCVSRGRVRNVAFACLGLAQPLGLSVGFVFGGVFASTVGWRFGWYLSSVAFFLLFVVALFAVPRFGGRHDRSHYANRLKNEVDWIGAVVICTCLSFLSFTLARITSDLDNIRQPSTIVLLCASAGLVPIFGFWTTRRQRRGEAALIANSIWKSRPFTSVCIMVFSSFAVQESMELFCSLYFQTVQDVSTLQSSLRLLPMCLMGIALNFITGMVVHRVSAAGLILLTSVVSAASPALMALLNPQWPYWYAEFPAQVVQPVSVDVIFTVGLLVISEIFPENTQALAGGVFNALAQLGISFGLAITGAVSRSVISHSSFANKKSSGALLQGYRAAFWTAFGWTLVACVVSSFGLRKLGRVGLKRD